ncbi:MAG: hypothetical protein M0T85_09590 [Dehalococcoidales bacterium]|nr:hypothetical protein [Dehalococcoidales bacterium]
MEAVNALIFVMGVYVLTLVVALFVGVVIVVIRRATAERAKPKVPSVEEGAKREGAIA